MKTNLLNQANFSASTPPTLLYVSSDRTEEQLTSYSATLKESMAKALTPQTGFASKPLFRILKNDDDKTAFKYAFGACAGSEKASLEGIVRNYGLPSLFHVVGGKVVAELMN